MNQETHLAELKRKHFELDETIDIEQKRPASCAIEISKLKKMKLSLKQKIETISKQESY